MTADNKNDSIIQIDNFICKFNEVASAYFRN